MSKKKWGFKKLASIREKLSKGYAIEDVLPEGSVFDRIPIDWYEFNQLYFSSRPVVVECPHTMWHNGDHLMALFSALRMSRDNRRVAIVSQKFDAVAVKTDTFYNSLTLKKDWKSKMERLALFNHVSEIDMNVADDLIAYANWTNDASIASEVLEWIERTNGFKDIEESEHPRYYRQTVFPKKFVVLWDSTNKKAYLKLKEKFGKKVLFLDYTHEKEMVDEWFVENKTIVDPVFDIKIMDPGLNLKKVYAYIATNHLPKLREYAKLFPETMEKYFTKEELGEMRCKFGPPYDRYNYGK